MSSILDTAAGLHPYPHNALHIFWFGKSRLKAPSPHLVTLASLVRSYAISQAMPSPMNPTNLESNAM